MTTGTATVLNDTTPTDPSTAASLDFAALSSATAQVVQKVAPSLVRVDDGSRLTATGVLWRDSIIVTTSHGVEQDDNLSVILHDGSRHDAQLVGRDNETDLAVLRIQASGLAAIEQAGTESGPPVGSLALAVARPGDMGLTATLGLVSSRVDTETAGAAEYIVSTDAVLYPGFSGGVLVGADGSLIGLLNRLYGRGMGVALGTPLVSRVVDTLLSHGRIPRGYLGVRTQLVALPDNLRAAQSIEQTRGLLVAQVETGSPAEKGGLLLGDVLLAINGQPVQDVGDLRQHLHAGQTVTLRVLRGGTVQELSTLVGADKA